MYLSRIEVKRSAGDFSAALAGLGWDFGLLRREGASPDHGWQLSLYGSADSIFNLDLPGDASGGGTPLIPPGCASITRARTSAMS